jgi:hypothetical protein
VLGRLLSHIQEYICMYRCMFEQFKQFSDLFVTRTPLLSRTGTGMVGREFLSGQAHHTYHIFCDASKRRDKERP